MEPDGNGHGGGGGAGTSAGFVVQIPAGKKPGDTVQLQAAGALPPTIWTERRQGKALS
eukprot:SAG22_NODE_2955_length_2078_cov_2.058110_3_plen_58_part_00